MLDALVDRIESGGKKLGLKEIGERGMLPLGLL